MWVLLVLGCQVPSTEVDLKEEQEELEVDMAIEDSIRLASVVAGVSEDYSRKPSSFSLRGSWMCNGH